MSKLFQSKKREVSKTEIDPQIYNRVLGNLAFAEQVAAIPYEPYRGLMVAPFTRDYMAGEAMTRRIAQEGGFVPEIEAAARQSLADLGYQAGPISTRGIDTRVTPERIAAERIGASLAGGPERVSVGQVAGPAAVQNIAAGRVGTTFAPERIGAERVGASLAGGPRFVGAGRVGTMFAARDIAAPGAAPTVQAASFLGRDVGGDLSAYANPYQQGVIDVGLSDIDRAQEQARMQRAQRATAARAFGGSRAAIEEGIAAGEAARERNRFVAEQRAQSFREAAALREADVGRQQQAALANQAAAQEVMRLAQAGQISNQERDMRLGQLGLTAETTNVQAQLEADRANQAAVQEYMRAGLTAEQANQQAQMDAAARNQQAGLEAQRMGLTAETTNVQAALEAARANQQAQAERERQAAQTGQFNVQAGLEGARANQNAVMQYMQMGLSAEEANQRAMADAAARNQDAALRARQLELGAGEQQAQRELEAQRMYEAARLQAGQFRGTTATNLANLGQMALQNRYGAGAAMMGLGSAQQNLYQQFLNAAREEDFRRQQFPLQQLAIRQGAVSASPYNVTQTGTVTSRPSYWQMAGQIGSTIAGFSDETMKKNVSKLKNPLDKVNRLKGIEFEWEDEYKDDVEENGQRPNGKSMSVSAQDVEDEMPEAVMRAGNGKMMVDFPQVVGLLTEAVKELDAKIEGKKRKGKK